MSMHRQRVVDRKFQRYIAQKKLSNAPEDIAIARQGEALLRSSTLSSASRPITPFSSTNPTRVNKPESSPSSPPSTAQHVATKPSVPLMKSQIPEVARPVKKYQGATSTTFFGTRLCDTKTAAKLEHGGKSFKLRESFQANKTKRKTQTTANTSRHGKTMKEPNPKYSWPRMAGGSGRYRHAEEASASWIQENTISQMENTGIAEALWHLGTKLDLSFPNGSNMASAAELRLGQVYRSPANEQSHEIDSDGVHVIRGFHGTGKVLEPILRTKSEVSVQANESVHKSGVVRKKVSFSHDSKLAYPWGAAYHASYKVPSLYDPAHPLSQSYRAATKTQKVLACRQQMPINYTTDENAIESDSEDEMLGGMEDSNTRPNPMFTNCQKLVPRQTLGCDVSVVHEQLQRRDSNDETAVESYTDNETFEGAFKGSTKMAKDLVHTQQETAKTSMRSRIPVRSHAKTATSDEIAPNMKNTRKLLIKKAVRFSKHLITKIDNGVSVVVVKDLSAQTGSANTTVSSSRSDSGIEMQSMDERHERKDSTDPSSVSSAEKLPRQKKLSVTVKGKQRAVESDGNVSDSSAATVIYSSTKVGRKRAVTAVRNSTVEVAVDTVEV